MSSYSAELSPQPAVSLNPERLKVLGKAPRLSHQAAGVSDADGCTTTAGAVAFAEEAARDQRWLFIHLRRYTSGLREVRELHLAPMSDDPIRPPVPQAIRTLADELRSTFGDSEAHLERGGVALTELLVNAVGHRSYAPSMLHRAVTVDVYTDRITIRSPGTDAGAGPDDEPGSVRRSRNPRLMHLLQRHDLARQMHSGLARARDKARRSGYKLTLELDGDDFVASLLFEPEMRLKAELADEGATEVRSRLPHEEREARILELMADRRPWTRRELQDKLGMARSTLLLALKRLQEAGKIVKLEEAETSGRQAYLLV